MGKMIAVCGSPNCGKTTAALKLAQEIYGLKKTSVMFLSPDLNVPCMAYLFPNGKDADLYSLGVALVEEKALLLELELCQVKEI